MLLIIYICLVNQSLTHYKCVIFMKLIITKSECKCNASTKIKSQKELKKNTKSLPVFFFSSDNLIDDLLFNRITFSERMALRSYKENKVFILENCSLYKKETLAHAGNFRH